MLHEIQRERESELLAVLKVSLKVFIRNDIDNTERSCNGCCRWKWKCWWPWIKVMLERRFCRFLLVVGGDVWPWRIWRHAIH